MDKYPLLRKGLSVGIILLFVGTCIIPAIAEDIEKPLPSSRGNWLYVGGNGPGTYTKIEDAIDNASDGDTVFVYNDSSPYYENTIVINTSISLIGENKNTTIIDGGGWSYSVIQIIASDVKISGFTIQNNSLDTRCTGILIRDPGGKIVRNTNISDNIFIDTANAIMEIKTRHSLISKNLIQSGGLHNNTVFGISSAFASSTIKDNIILNPRFIGIDAQFTHCLIEGNIIQNGSQPTSSFGINQRVCWNKIIDNEITNFMFALTVEDGFAIISQNNISDAKNGITIDSMQIPTPFSLITRNSISNCEHGLMLSKTYGTFIKENNFIHNNISAMFYRGIGHFWIRNYWDDWDGQGPMVIKGYKGLVEFDWHPALQPYDIGGITGGKE